MGIRLIMYVVFSIYFLSACQPDRADTAESAAPPSYEKASVIRARLPIPIYAHGQLELSQEVLLSFRLGGYLEKTLWEEGAQVRQNQLLASLNQDELRERLRQAKEREKKIKVDVERTQNLFDQQIGTLSQLEELQTSYEIAQSDRKIAEKSLRDSYLYAPNAGIILEKYREPGEFVSPGQPIYRISGRGQAYIFKAGLTDEQILRVHLNDSCTIDLQSVPLSRITGRVARIATVPNPQTQQYEVEIVLNPSNTVLKSGFRGELKILAPPGDAWAIIPPEALVDADKNQAKVYHEGAEGKLLVRDIEIAYVLDSGIAVSKGLEGIEEVIIP